MELGRMSSRQKVTSNDNTEKHQLLGEKQHSQASVRQKFNVDENGNTDLHLAAKNGESDIVLSILQDKQTIETLVISNNDGWLPLHLAVDMNRVDIVRQLVRAMNENGYSEKLDSKCQYPLLYDYHADWTALHIAVYRRHDDCIVELNGLNPNSADRRGVRPVYVAAEFGYSQVLRTFLETFSQDSRFEMNVANNYGLTALMNSAVVGSASCVQVLLEYGANVETTSKSTEYEGQNVLHMTVRKSVEEPHHIGKYQEVYNAIKSKISAEVLVRTITSGGKCSFKPHFEQQQMTVVEFGSAIGAIDITSSMIRQLSTNESNVGQIVKSLHAAANYGQPGMVRILVDVLSKPGFSSHLNDKMDFPLEFGYKEKWTALHIAVYRGHLSCIKQLKDLDPQIADKRLYRPVHLAADSRTKDKLEVFLETFSHHNDKELNETNKYGWTPLMMSASLGNVDGVKLLVSYGANVAMTVPSCNTKKDRADGDEYKNQNVLHIIVKNSVEEPNNIGRYLEIYKILVQPYIDNKLVQRFDENLLQTKGFCSFGERFANKEMTVLQYAAAVGAVDMLDAMVDSLLADKRCEESCDKALKYLAPNEEQTKSCLELISSHCTLSEMAQMERIQSMTKFVSKFAYCRTVLFCFMLTFHMLHMSFLTSVTTSVDDQSSFANTTLSPCETGAKKYLLFLLWPSALLIYEFICLLMSIFRLISWHKEHVSLMPERSQYRIIYLDVIGHVATVVFSVLMWAWYLNGRPQPGECSFNPRRNIGLSAVILVWGWMQTLEYIRYPRKLHTFVAILKLIIITDVFYISLIYSFVLVGFAGAIYVYLLADNSLSPEMSFNDCVYHVYTTMLGDGKLFDNDVISASNSHMVRSVFAIYLCLSIVVLLNMLIAMMNNRYANVLDMRRSLWYIETVNSIAWTSDLPQLVGCRRLFKTLAADIKKPMKVEPNEDDIKKLHRRINVIETNLEDLRNTLGRRVNNASPSRSGVS